MASPFSAYANSTIFIPLLGTVAERDDTGNWVVTGGGTLEVRALLKMSSQRGQGSSTTKNEGGVDGATILVDGYLTDPIFFPESVSLPNRFACQIQGPNRLLRGELEIKASLLNPFGVEPLTGQKIAGVFHVEDGV
ncbi:MAG: hypothetical protein IM550_10700 [Microcystis sp. M54BS1]|uniref:hypothetical protein n=1 Tax=unclassified Microcystis TaxID=2643300 RepID=UPI00257DDED1|nr:MULTISPECIES: hypothetical protein [unclassified Microcystis]MCA2539678.1 hypothetical protein [Microcystis sp. M54BS1]MCA2596209.1 hypothetical protein [Microcystis sp. M38BS1]MCA2612849.1 hypothetical protein [Microcystis sp. M27BS1]MCA2504922.1 hypothetical protein [Microcystis sp. M62BS1]MCA2513641.1 hypothetical protein [Microcystis sp. M60BS1]